MSEFYTRSQGSTIADSMKPTINTQRDQYVGTVGFGKYLHQYFRKYGYALTDIDEKHGYQPVDSKVFDSLFNHATWNYANNKASNEYGSLSYNPWNHAADENEAWSSLYKSTKKVPTTEEYQKYYNVNYKYKGQYDSGLQQDVDAKSNGLAPYRVQVAQHTAQELQDFKTRAQQLGPNATQSALQTLWSSYKYLPALTSRAQEQYKKTQEEAAKNGETADYSLITGTPVNRDKTIDYDALQKLGYDTNNGFQGVLDTYLNRATVNSAVRHNRAEDPTPTQTQQPLNIAGTERINPTPFAAQPKLNGPTTNMAQSTITPKPLPILPEALRKAPAQQLPALGGDAVSKQQQQIDQYITTFGSTKKPQAWGDEVNVGGVWVDPNKLKTPESVQNFLTYFKWYEDAIQPTVPKKIAQAIQGSNYSSDAYGIDKATTYEAQKALVDKIINDVRTSNQGYEDAQNSDLPLYSSAANSMTAGLLDYLTRSEQYGSKIKALTDANPTAAKVGDLLGMALPIGKATGLVGQGLTKIAPQLVERYPMIANAIKGGAAFGVYGAVRDVADGKSPAEVARNAVGNILAGAAFDVGGNLVAKQFGKLIPRPLANVTREQGLAKELEVAAKDPEMMSAAKAAAEQAGTRAATNPIERAAPLTSQNSARAPETLIPSALKNMPRLLDNAAVPLPTAPRAAELTAKPLPEIAQRLPMPNTAMPAAKELPRFNPTAATAAQRLPEPNPIVPRDLESLRNSGKNMALEARQSSITSDSLFLPEEPAVRQSRTNTLEHTTDLTDAAKANLPESGFEYTPERVTEWNTLADAAVRDNRPQVIKAIENTDVMSGGQQVFEAAAIAKQYAREAATTGNYSQFRSWLEKIAPKITEDARALKAWDAAWSKTPEGVALQAERVVKKAEEVAPRGVKEAIDSETGAVNEALGKAGRESADAVAKEFTPKAGKKESTPAEVLAQRIESAVKPKEAHERDLIREMVNELFAVAKESPLPTKEGMPAPRPIERVAASYRARQQYVETWKQAKEIVKTYFADNPDALAALDQYFNSGIRPPHSMQAFESAFKNGLKDLNINMAEVMKHYFVDGKANKQALIDYLVKQSGLTGDAAKSYANAIDSRWRSLMKERSEQYLRSVLKPGAKSLTLVPRALSDIEAISNAGGLKNTKFMDDVIAKLPQKIRQLVRENKVDIEGIVLQGRSVADKEKMRFVKDLSEKLNIDPRDMKTVLDTAMDEFDKLTADKRASLLNRKFAEKAKATKKAPFEQVMELVNLGGYDDAAIRDIIKAKNKLPVLDNTDIQTIFANLNEAAKYTEGSYQNRMFMDKAYQVMGSKLPTSFAQKLTRLPQMAMLSGVKTFLSRNFLGNVINDVYNTALEAGAAPLDAIISKATGTSRTTFFPTPKALLTKAKGYGIGAIEQAMDLKNGVNTAPNLVAGEIGKGPVFKNRALNKADELLQAGMQFGDRPVYQGSLDMTRAQLAKAGQTTPAEAEALSKFVAQRRTFQDRDNPVSAALGQIRKGMDTMTSEYTGSDQWGVGKITLPFTTTGGSILDQALEGAVGVGKVPTLVKTLNSATGADRLIAQRALVEAVARNVGGAASAVLGGYLFLRGVITGKAPKDTDAAAANTMQGLNAYSLNLDSFQRLITGQDPAPVAGDHYMSFDWAQPVTMPWAIAADVIANYKEGQPLIQSIASGTLTGAQSALNLSVLQGLVRLFNGGNLPQGLANAVGNYPAQYVPQTGRSLAQYVDDTQRQTYDPNAGKQFLNGLQAQIPWASKSLPPKINTLGQESKQYGGENGFFNVFLNPARSSTYNPSPVLQEAARLYQATGKTGAYPKVAEKEFNYKTPDGIVAKVTMSAGEYTAFQKAIGKMSVLRIDALMRSAEYQKMTDDERVAAITKEISYSDKWARFLVLNTRGKLPWDVTQKKPGYAKMLGKMLDVSADDALEMSR